MLALAGRLLPVRRLCPNSFVLRASPRATSTRSRATLAVTTTASNPGAPVSNDPFEATKLQCWEVTPEHVETLKALQFLFSEDKGQLAVRPDGLVSVLDVLGHPWMANSTMETLHDVVRWDKQRRFEMVYRPRIVSPVSEDWWLRIREGYFQDPDLSLARVASPRVVPVAVYSTTPEAWERIKNSGIPRGDAPFIHLARSIPGREPIFGKKPHVPRNPSRPASLTTHTRHPLPEIRREKIDKVVIYVNTTKVMKSDIPLYTSQRGTIATPGNDYGALPPHVFRRIELVEIRMERVIHEVDEGSGGGVQEQGDIEPDTRMPLRRHREWRGQIPSSSANSSLKIMQGGG